MKRYLLLSVIVFITTISLPLSAERIEIKGLSTTKSGDPLILPARFAKPTGEGPFPAVIMLHHCDGDNQYLNPWEERFVNWGYAVLRVDSLTPRQLETLCKKPFEKPRAQDAFDAKSYLMAIPSIDKDKISVVGWGQGAASSLIVIDDTSKIQNRGTPFRAVVAFYPLEVYDIKKQNAPLLVLSGEKAKFPSPATLRIIFSLSKSPYETELKIYENATACFDWEGFSGGSFQGVKMEYNQEAAEAAILEVQKFLSKYLK
jgi:dienelactone hydrolase